MSHYQRYQIDLPDFSGPLDLLLHLIDRQELDITVISLTQVTGQYLAQIEKLKEHRIEQLIDFLVVGARLAQIKSRALLPQTPVTSFDDDDEEDPAEALVRQLRLYKRFKQIATWLHHRQQQGWRTYLRVVPPPKLNKQIDLTGVTIDSLQTAVWAVWARAEMREDSVAIIQPRQITIERQISLLRHQTKRKKALQFSELLSSQTNRVEVAITLLAVLELVKRHEIIVRQDNLFGPIEISANISPAQETTTTTHVHDQI